jgi:hypothetical protein
VSDLGDRQLLIRDGAGASRGDDALRVAIERAGFMPRSAASDDGVVLQETDEERAAE